MQTTFFWFRRDLRLDDNTGLFHALNENENVQCVFIFDRKILDDLTDRADRRVQFIHHHILKLDRELSQYGSSLLVKYGNPEDVWRSLVAENDINAVYTNHDYEPYAKERDEKLKGFFNSKGITFATYKDQVIFEKEEVVKDDGSPYTVYTPYSKKWKALLAEKGIRINDTQKLFAKLKKSRSATIPSLEEMGFKKTIQDFPEPNVTDEILKRYAERRDIPSVHGTSRLSVHLRFGTISVRKLYQRSLSISEKYCNELIWREFYMMILWHFPFVINTSFKKQYEFLPWRNHEPEFQAWCEGRTGFPIVDAGMRELNATGWMHNRVRMITAMFLTKYLLIDWRWGEAYFAERLIDFELSSNNGGWQWSAGTGVDAAPYFRIFNMDEQTKRFDPELKYVRKWVPEFEDPSYPKPIVDYKMARQRCLEFYKQV